MNASHSHLSAPGAPSATSPERGAGVNGTLSERQREHYQRDGFVTPMRAISTEQAAALREELEAFERRLGAPLTTDNAPQCRYKTHLLLPWVAELVRNEAILDAVESLIGPDILCWTSTWFIKEPRSEAITIWHQDATYFGLRPHEHVTAWVALTPSTPQSGCLRFVPGSNALGQLRHVARADPRSINGGGQRTERQFELSETVPAPLAPGEFSLHHTLCVHTSGANTTDERRIGIGISYVPARVHHIGSQPMPASLVRGEDRYGHFELEHTPQPWGGAEVHARHYASYRAGYNEQMQWHAEGRWD